MHTLLTDDVVQTVVCSVVASRLDYCNALLSGVLAVTFDKQQHTQNNLARVVCQSRSLTDAKPLLRSLHWLPVRQRVTYKVDLLTHKVRTTALQRISASWYGPMHHLGLCALPMLQHSSFLAYTPTGPLRFFCCCSIHLELYLLTFDCAKTFSLSNAI